MCHTTTFHRSGTYFFVHHGGPYSAGHSIDSGSHSQIIQTFILLSDGVLCIYPGTLHIALLQGLDGRRADGKADSATYVHH